MKKCRVGMMACQTSHTITNGVTYLPIECGRVGGAVGSETVGGKLHPSVAPTTGNKMPPAIAHRQSGGTMRGRCIHLPNRSGQSVSRKIKAVRIPRIGNQPMSSNSRNQLIE